MGVPVVLLAGGRGVGKKHVAGAVRGSDVSSEVTSAPWKIDTKYYRADAEIRVLGADADGSPGEDGDVQAVVVVFDVTREASFREAKALWERIKADEEAVKLLVANDPRGAGTSPTWIDEVQGWCVDNLIELVEVKHGEEGREGLDRVAEALHAHQWPGLRMKRRPGPPLRSAPAADRGESSSSNDQELPMAAFLEGGLPDDDGLARAFAMVARAWRESRAGGRGWGANVGGAHSPRQAVQCGEC